MKACFGVCLALALLLGGCKKKLGAVPESDCAKYDAVWVRLCIGHTADRCLLENPTDIAAAEAALNETLKPNQTVITAAKMIRERSGASFDEVQNYKKAMALVCWNAQYKLYISLLNSLPKDKMLPLFKKIMGRSYSDFPSFQSAKTDADLLKLSEKARLFKFPDSEPVQEVFNIWNRSKSRNVQIAGIFPPGMTPEEAYKASDLQYKSLKLELEFAEKTRSELQAWMSKYSNKLY